MMHKFRPVEYTVVKDPGMDPLATGAQMSSRDVMYCLMLKTVSVGMVLKDRNGKQWRVVRTDKGRLMLEEVE